MASTPESLVCFHCTAERAQGNELEIEEENISSISWAVLDVKSNQIIAAQKCVVKSGHSGSTEALKTCRSAGLLFSEAEELGEALEQFNEFIQDKLPGTHWCLLTEGPTTLRHFLHSEAARKKLKLAQHFHSYFDLCREVQKAVKSNTEFTNLREIASHCKIDVNNNSSGLEECNILGNVLQYLCEEGHKLSGPERINMKYEPGPCLGPILDDTVLRARGLPWQASDQDVATFFRGLNILSGGIAFCLNSQGRRNGEAFIRFERVEQRELALKRHKYHLGSRYIEVYRATAQDFLRIVRGPMDVTHIAATFVANKAEVIIRVRGLPFSSKTSEVVKFFGNDSPVYGGEAGVLIVRNQNGKATGDAFVLFETEDYGRAALKKHREILGSRYVELFRSSQSEVQQVLSSFSNFVHNIHPILLPPPPAQQQHRPFHHPLFLQSSHGSHGPINGITTKDCLRLRGLPFSASVQDVLDFLKEHAAYVVPGGVHMVYNTQGRPSGDAYVQLLSPEYAQAAAVNLHKQHMGERYIEVFPCANADIAMIVASSTINQTKLSPPNNIAFSRPAISYPMSSTNGAPVNGHATETVATSPTCRSPLAGMYLQHPAFYNCMLPSSGIVGSNNINYYAHSAGNMRLRYSPFMPQQPFEVMPFYQGYHQIADYR